QKVLQVAQLPLQVVPALPQGPLPLPGRAQGDLDPLRPLVGIADLLAVKAGVVASDFRQKAAGRVALLLQLVNLPDADQDLLLCLLDQLLEPDALLPGRLRELEHLMVRLTEGVQGASKDSFNQLLVQRKSKVRGVHRDNTPTPRRLIRYSPRRLIRYSFTVFPDPVSHGPHEKQIGRAHV